MIGCCPGRSEFIRLGDANAMKKAVGQIMVTRLVRCSNSSIHREIIRINEYTVSSFQSLGNHEFDDGVDGLVPFIQNASFPIVTSNLDLSKEPKLAATNLLNSTVLTVGGTKIGVIGYLTTDTKIISRTEEVIFLDEVESVRREAERLKKQGVNILIALGHSGFTVDKKIAREVEDIDLVVGGHTNTFLYNGKQPDAEVPEGLYPTEVTQKNGRKVYVVQAYAYTKYLGNFTVKFNSAGEVTEIKGNPVLVDSSIEQVIYSINASTVTRNFTVRLFFR